MKQVLGSSTRKFLVLAFFASTLSACASRGQAALEEGTAAPPKAPLSLASTSTKPAPSNMVETVDRVLPSVVSVMSSKTMKAPPMGFFFGMRPAPEKQQGVGSGVILTKDGIIVTNNHVVEGADEVVVRLADDREFPAKVLGTDPKSDLAVLEIDRSIGGLVPITIGDSAALRLGESVLAVGNPFGVGQTVTMGIVSAKGRADMGITDYEDFIQTDAAINPGNSGGALVNERGELVGINTAILSKSGGSMGIGFAIPTQMAVPIVEALRTEGKVSRGFLGVAIQDLNGDLRGAMGLGETDGVILADVDPKGPGAQGGLKSGDVIVSVGENAVHSTGQFRNLIASAGAKKRVDLVVFRDGKKQNLSVELGQLPDDPSKNGGAVEAGKSTSEHAGLGLRALDEEVRARLHLGAETSGVIIARVEPGSKAASAGLRPYDIIVEIDRSPVVTPEAAKKLLSTESGKGHLLKIQRSGSSVFVVLK